jgi:hypothetical protein
MTTAITRPLVLAALAATMALAQSPPRVSNAAPPAAPPQRRTFVLAEDQVFPHFATGGGWETTFVLVNMTATRVAFVQGFFDQSGKPMEVSYRSIPGGETTTANNVQGTLNPGASFNIVLFDSGTPLKVGWSAIAYDTTFARIGGHAIFRNRVAGRADFEAVVPLSAYDDTTFFLPFDNLQDFVTSMAILNPTSNLSTRVALTFLDTNAEVIATDVITLEPGQQTAFSLPEKYPAVRGRIGTLFVQSEFNRLSALGFRFNPQGAFTTIPILNWLGMF